MNLRYLNEHGCIEKIAHVDKSRSYWNVENFENIKNIRSEFEDVKLNGYEKGIILVLQKNGYRVTDLGGFFTYIQLLLSKSFFNACIDTSIDILSSRVGNIYHYYNAGFYRQMVENSRECYIAFSERYPNIKISGSDFAHILNEISGKHREFSSNEEFINIWKEKIQKLTKEKLVEIDDDWNIYNRIRITVETLVYLKEEFYDTLFSLLFESYFLQDVLLDIALEEEKTYAIENRANNDEYHAALNLKKDKDESLKKLVFSDFEQAAIVMAKHKQPSLFDKKVYDNAEDINQSLRIYFKTEIQKLSK